MQDSLTSDTVTVTSTTGGTPHEVVAGLTSIIIPIFLKRYDLLHYTGNLIGSIKEHTDKLADPYEIILIDNGSPIKFPDPMLYNCDMYVRNEVNMGVTRAWNQGIRMSHGDYICLLNNDTLVFDNWLHDMKEGLKYHDLIMAKPMYGEPFSRAVEAKAKRDKYMQKPIGESFTDDKDFSCVIMARDLLSHIGLFDDRYYNYSSDTDFIKRLVDAGATYASDQRVPIFHVIGATSSILKETPEEMNKDRLAFKLKWEHPSSP